MTDRGRELYRSRADAIARIVGGPVAGDGTAPNVPDRERVVLLRGKVVEWARKVAAAETLVPEPAREAIHALACEIAVVACSLGNEVHR